MINIRKLAAVEMAWLGTGVIITEYALGASMPLFLGVLSIRSALLSPILELLPPHRMTPVTSFISFFFMVYGKSPDQAAALRIPAIISVV